MKKLYWVYDYCGCSMCQKGGLCAYRPSHKEELTAAEAESRSANTLVEEIE